MGSLLFISIGDFFSKYLKQFPDIDISKYEIIVVSKDIIADQRIKNGSTFTYESRYKNIGFALELFPNPQVLEFYHGSTFLNYREQFLSQLSSTKAATALCCIADLVVNDDLNVVLLCSGSEYLMEFMNIIQEKLYEMFHLNGWTYDQYKEDPTCLNNIGDKEDILKRLEFEMKQLELIEEGINEFFNKFIDDMAEKYKEILMSKSVDALYKYALKNDIHVNKHKPKELIVDHILQKVLAR